VVAEERETLEVETGTPGRRGDADLALGPLSGGGHTAVLGICVCGARRSADERHERSRSSTFNAPPPAAGTWHAHADLAWGPYGLAVTA